ncbi:restriction endonuclease subunit S [Photobacterium chitinilyticum]|uniref:ATPase n=1 Tax=Photobacterium chitinilyticum TaxID=2485123 RepID=A0A444JRM7_9GAMM|nr:restriction endonuclease subunit S [Photobacterium chitinilyticum]RWX55699.1 ATPase [Photobacterium chitinilyticum]
MLDNLSIPNDIEKEPELPIPSIEEQKRIVETLKRLEEAGELTPEILEQYMTGQRVIDEDS